jgi:methylthioribose-1-phosphate isomerase
MRGVLARTIWWADDGVTVVVIDQTVLPHRAATATWRTLTDVADGIRTMQVRGAPLIGVAAAHGVALALHDDPLALDHAVEVLRATRPTAVNLGWALERCHTALTPVAPEQRFARARALSIALADADAAASWAIGAAGLPLLAAVHERTGRTVQVLTHCNAGALATVERGTATAPIYAAVDAGIPVHVWVSETRPRNQGALTAWELARAGVPHTFVVDNAAGHLLAGGMVDLVITGADRIAANGDTANKIGTLLKAIAAREHGVPFHVAAPASTFDPRSPDGAGIPIEERSADEVLLLDGHPIAPADTTARNWAFDVTPARLVTSWITDRGVVTADQLPVVLDG